MNLYVVLAYTVSLLMMGSLAAYCWWCDRQTQKDLRNFS